MANKLSAWRQTNLDWLHNFTGPMHVMFYDQLIEDVATHLQDLLRFLRLNVSEQNMACALEWREGIYRRKRRVINFDPFTATMKQALRKEQDAVYEAIATLRTRQRPYPSSYGDDAEIRNEIVTMTE